MPTARRGLPGVLLRAGGDRLLFDAGEGTQQQLLRSVGLPELDAIFLTHYHLDHWLGLVGMLKTFDLRGREVPLAVYGPPGLRALFGSLRGVIGRLGYPLALVELDRHDEVALRRLRRVAVPGRAPRHGLRLRVRGGRAAGALRRRDRRAARGRARARTSGACRRARRSAASRPEQVVGPPRPGRRIVISGDTAPCQAVEVFAHGADLLVHEATFLPDERARARETGHSTAARRPRSRATPASACSR